MSEVVQSACGITSNIKGEGKLGGNVSEIISKITNSEESTFKHANSFKDGNTMMFDFGHSIVNLPRVLVMTGELSRHEVESCCSQLC